MTALARLELAPFSLEGGLLPLRCDAPFRLMPGERAAVLGPSGAGKSSWLSLLAGLPLPVAAGAVLPVPVLEGRPLPAWTPRERAARLAWVGQEMPAEAGFSVRDLVLQGLTAELGPWGEPSAAQRAQADALLEEVGLAGRGERPLTKLSGGERRRVLLARALCTGAPLLLLDEPTAHLDVARQAATLQQLTRRCSAGSAVVVVLHDPNLARAWAERVVFIHADGRVQVGGPELLTAEGLGTLYGHPVVEHGAPQGWFAPRLS